MECNEKFMRQMLDSCYSDAIGAAILDRLDGANTMTIVLADGSRVCLKNREDALRELLERFGWQHDGAEESAAGDHRPAA